jgi:hypothetical protein
VGEKLMAAMTLFAIVSAFLATNAVVINLAMTLISILYQRSRQKKLEAEQDKLKGFDIPVDGEPIHLPIVYGRQKVGGVRTMPITRNSIALPSATGQGFQTKVFPTTSWDVGVYSPSYTAPTPETSYVVSGGRFDGEQVDFVKDQNPPDQPGVRGGSKREYLLLEQALCFGGIQSIETVEVNGEPWNKGAKFDHRIDSSVSGGTANPMSTVNGFPSTNKFTNCAWLAGAFKLNRDSPNYSGVPTLSAYVLGSRVWHIRINSSNNKELDVKTYSDNSALVLMDYLLRPKSLGGVGLGGLTSEQWDNDVAPSTEFIDIDAFQRSAQIAGTVIETLTTMKGLINNVPPVDVTVQSLSDLDQMVADDSPDLVENYAAYVLDEDGVWIFGGGFWYPSNSATRQVKLYECHMTLDTERNFRDNIELILETMNEAELIYSNGRYRLVLEYPTTLAEQESIISKTFTDSNIVDDQLSSQYPGTSERYNRAIVKFKDEELNFSQNSVSWPEYLDANNLKMLSEDGGKISETNIFLPGCSNRWAAIAKAENIVRASRLYSGDEVSVVGSGSSQNQRIITLVFDRTAIVLESGDLFKLSSEVFGITEEVFRVETVSFTAELNVNITAAQFSFTNLTYSDKSLNSIYPGVSYSEAIYKISQLAYTKGNLPSSTTPSNGYLSWSPPANTKVSRYHIETTVDNNFWEGERYTKLGTTSRENFPVPVEFSSGEFRYFRVRVEDDEGDIGPGVDVYVNNFDIVDVNNRQYTVTPFIYGLKVAWNEPTMNLIEEFRVYYSETNTKPNQWLHVAKQPDFTLEPLSADSALYIWIDAVSWDGFIDEMTTPLSGTPLAAADWASFEVEAQTSFETFSADMKFDISTLETALVTTNSNLDSNSTSISGLITRVTDSEGDITAQASDITSLSTTVGTNTTNITTQTSSINGVKAVHGVEIDNNGHISGFGLISDLVDNNVVSEFLINADNFRVGSSVDSVNYTSPFQVSGNTTYIKKAVIKDADIETLKIQGNAVTVPLAQTSNINLQGNNTMTEVQWLSLTLDYPGQIYVQWSGAQGYSSGAVNHLIELRVKGVTVMARGGDAINDMPNLTWASSAPYAAGTHRVGIWWKGLNSGITLGNGTLAILGAKR